MTVTEDWASGRWYPHLHIPRWFTTGQSHKGRCCQKANIRRCYGVHSWRGSGMQRRYLMLHIWICIKKMWAYEMIIVMLFDSLVWPCVSQNRTLTISLQAIYFSLCLSVCLSVSLAPPPPSPRSILLCFPLSLVLLHFSVLDSLSPSESLTPSESHFSHLFPTVCLPLFAPPSVSLPWLILTVVPAVVFVVCLAPSVWSHTRCQVD